MRTRIIFIFILTILIPTAMLAYFGLLAVRSEKSIVEKSMQERYEFMADIVEGEIKKSLAELPQSLLKNKKYFESILIGKAAIFKGRMKILDQKGRVIGGPAGSFTSGRGKKQSGLPAFSRPIKDLFYAIAVYEHQPLLLKRLEKRKNNLYLYIVLISSSALIILCGGVFTLGALSREWRLARLKSEFVSNLSHDLKRPLTSIRMFSEMLKDDRVPSQEKRQEYYNIIANESERLTYLAHNILDFSRIERGRKRYDLKPEDIVKVVRETVEHFKTYMVNETGRVNFELKEDESASLSQIMVRIDAESISQALMNLIFNAVKFSSPDKEIKEIKVNLVRNKKEVVIEIIDQGIGIPKRELKNIFKKFYRTRQKRVTEIEGSGLGLALVKYTVEAHRGRIEVESIEGKGSKFSLILPVSS